MHINQYSVNNSSTVNLYQNSWDIKWNIQIPTKINLVYLIIYSTIYYRGKKLWHKMGIDLLQVRNFCVYIVHNG